MNNTEINKMNEALLNLKFPHIKQPVVYWGEKRKQYYNTFTKARGNALEKVVSKDTLKNNDYTLIKRSGQVTSRYLLMEIKELEAILIAEMRLCFTGIVSKDISWEIASCGIYKKDKTCFPLLHLGHKGKKRLYGFEFNALYTDWVLPVVCTDEMVVNGQGKAIAQKFADNHPNLNIDTSLMILSQAHENGIDRVSFTNWARCEEDGKCGINGETFAEMSAPIEKLYDGKIKALEGCNVVDITKSPSDFAKFIRLKEAKSSIVCKNNAFLNISLPIVKYNTKYDNCVGIIQRVNDNMCVLRTMQKDDANKKMIDVCKVFVDKNSCHAFKKNTNGNWSKMKITTKLNGFNFKLLGYDSSNTKGTMLEYFTSIIKDIPLDKRDSVLKYLLADSDLEVMLKSSLKDFIISYICDPYKNFSYEEWKHDHFGKFNPSQKSLYKKFGVNKHQFDFIVEQYNKNTKDKIYTSEFWYINRKPSLNFPELHHFFDIDGFTDLSFIDDKSFDKIANIIIEEFNRNDYYYPFYRVMKKVYEVYGIPTLINFLEYRDAFYEAVKEDYVIDSSFMDYLDMLSTLKGLDDFDIFLFKPYFDKNNSVKNIKAMHDILLPVFNIKLEEIERKREEKRLEEKRKYYETISKNFETAISKCNKWEFENGDFAVLKPSHPLEVAHEGIELKHCVGSYIERIAKNETNIMFIRKTSDKTKPFYTVEISNGGIVEQVHGSCNCCVEEGSDLEKFVKTWVKERHLSLNNINKIR